MEQLWVYITSVVILTLIPGPDLVFLITQGLTKGRKEAVFTALGLSSGCFFSHDYRRFWGVNNFPKIRNRLQYLENCRGILSRLRRI